MFVSTRTFQGRKIQTPERLEFQFPNAETVTRYSVNTNAVNWSLKGSLDDSLWDAIDTEMYQYTLRPEYTIPDSSYKYFRFESNLVQGSNTLNVTTLTFTNTRGYLLAPNLTATTTTSVPIVSTPIIPTQTRQYAQIQSVPPVTGNVIRWSMGSNVTVGHIRFYPFDSTSTLIGQSGTTFHTLASSSNVCSCVTPVSNVYLVTPKSTVTTLLLYDLLGNELTQQAVAGAYKGLSNTTGHGYGEWLQVDFQDEVPTSAYSIRVNNYYPTWWLFTGSNDGTTWTRLDEQRNVYDQFTLFSNACTSGSYKKYRVVFKAYYGSLDAQIASVNIYDDKGTVLVPATTSNSFIPKVEYFPTSSSNVSIDPGSPFIDGVTWISTGTNSSFAIIFEIPVSVNKVYMQNSSSNVRIIGDSKTLLDTTLFNNVATLTTVTPTKRFIFTNFPTGARVSNVMIFGSDGGRLNPYFSTYTTSRPAYGGPVRNEIISISLPLGSSNGNMYSFVSTLSSWKLEGNINSNWVTLDDVSNVYTETVPYQQYFKSNNAYTDYKLTVREMLPTAQTNPTFRMNCFQIFSNTLAPMIPLASTSLVGKFSITCSDIATNNILKLFAYQNSEDVTINATDTTESITGYPGKYIQVLFPYPVPIKYYQLTVGNIGAAAPSRWTLFGTTNGTTWSNILSSESYSSTPASFQSNVYHTSNSTPFIGCRLVIGGVMSSAYTRAYLQSFGLYSNFGIITPNGSSVSYGNELYGGYGDQWIQCTFPINPSALSYIRLEANALPSNVYIEASSDINRTDSRIIARYSGYTGSNAIVIPINSLGATENCFRIVATEMSANPYGINRFELSNIGFYNSDNLRLHAYFSPDPAQTDALNQTINITQSTQYGGKPLNSIASNIIINLSQSKVCTYHLLRSSYAKTWRVDGSVDNGVSWNQIDRRTVDKPIVSATPSAYIFYNPVTTPYSNVKLTIEETFKTTDGSIAVNEFAILNEDRKRITKRSEKLETSRLYDWISGCEYTGTEFLEQTPGEFLTWSFPYVRPFSNVTIFLDSNKSYIREISVFGKNTESTWTMIHSREDRTMTGTFELSGTVSNPDAAFTVSNYCQMLPTSNVQITLPYPIKAGYYSISVPSVSDVTGVVFSRPTKWRITAGVNRYETTGLIDFGSSSGFVSIPMTVPEQKYTFEILETDNPGTPAIIQVVTMYDTDKYPLYLSQNFTVGNKFHNIEKGQWGDPYFTIEFPGMVNYSNIAISVGKYTSDPHIFDGCISNFRVDFKPTKFRGIGSNYTNQYDNEPSDIITNSVPEYVVLGNNTKHIKSATGYSFDSTNANVWSLYGSQDGLSWTVLDENATGTTKTRPLSTITPASYYKLEVNSITNITDGTTNISNLSVYDSISKWPPVNMTSNLYTQVTTVSTNTYGERLGLVYVSG